MPYAVVAERLGWPRRRWWHVVLSLLGEAQGRMQYKIEPLTPTATCHLQPGEGRDAACDYPAECLIAVPGQP